MRLQIIHKVLTERMGGK